jgi:HPt (histidine-containing phosphotransfer) domain-containing protein
MKHYDREFHIEQFESEKTCNAMLKFFLREVPEHLATLLTTVNNNNLIKASFVAKTIRSAAKLMGAYVIEDTAAELENLLESQTPLDYDTTNIITELCSKLLEQNKTLGDIATPYLKGTQNNAQLQSIETSAQPHTIAYKKPSPILRPLL